MTFPEADTALFLIINRGLSNKVLDVVMPFVTRFPVVLFLAPALWVFYRRKDKALSILLIALAALALADATGNLLKNLISRPRPCAVIEGINLLVGCGHAFSMPSNHAVNSFAAATVLWYFSRGFMGLSFFCLAAVVGFSRIYVGVHYPLDVIGGAFFGSAAGWGAIFLSRWVRRVREKDSYGEALLLVLLLLSLFRMYYILTGPFDLSPDEAHYWEWSRHPALSYYSKGPMIAWLIGAGTAFFGDTVFGVRILAVLLSALSSAVIYRLASGLYGERTGFFAALLIQIVPLYSVYGVLLTIDSPFIFFWVVSLYLFWKAVGRKSPPSELRSDLYWTLLGLAIGLGLLTKYTMAFFCLSGFIFLCVDRDSRSLLLSRGPYLALLVSLVVFSPVIVWNAQNGWVTIKHTAGQAHVYDGLAFSAWHFFEFLGSQLGVVTPLLFVMIFLALWKLGKGRERTFLLSFSVPVIVFFLLKSVQGKVQANWALPAYVTGFIAFAAYYMRKEQPISATRKVVAPALFLAVLITVFAYFPSVLNLPRKMDPSARLLGWKGLGMEAGRIYREMSDERPAFIFSPSYQVASELAFYIKEHPTTYCINLGRRMNQYDLWPGFEDLKGYNAIFVMGGDEDLPRAMAGVFERYEKVLLSISTGRGRVVKFTLFKCYDFRGITLKPAESY